MNEKTLTEQTLESIRKATADPTASSLFSWETAGEILGILVVAALTMWVITEAKKFKAKKNKDNEN
jgi:hypothetical protein